MSVIPDQFAVSSVGDSITLSCTPGDTSLSIDWYRGSQLLTVSTKYTFSPTVQRYMLTITNIQLNDANDYYCTLADNEISDNLKIELIVIEGTYIHSLTICIVHYTTNIVCMCIFVTLLLDILYLMVRICMYSTVNNL